jgi:hypothetical protein
MTNMNMKQGNGKDDFDRVSLRRWNKKRGGDVIAILWDATANPGKVMMYEHIGQHGEGDYQTVLQRTTHANWTDADATALLSELEGLGYNTYLVSRRPKGK